jgi:hypothetical protein
MKTGQRLLRSLSSLRLPGFLKTGHALAGLEHRAQTMLYTLLPSERYAADVQEELLFYTKSEGGEVVRVLRGRNEIRGLIGVRNEIAGYIRRRTRDRKKGRKDRKDCMDMAGEVNELLTEKMRNRFCHPQSMMNEFAKGAMFTTPVSSSPRPTPTILALALRSCAVSTAADGGGVAGSRSVDRGW